MTDDEHEAFGAIMHAMKPRDYHHEIKDERDRLRADNVLLRDALAEAIEGYEECSQYKGDYLRSKHGDDDYIARLRAILKETQRADV